MAESVVKNTNTVPTWKQIASASKGNVVQCTIPSYANEIMFMFWEPSTKIFSTKIYPKERVIGSAISIVYEGSAVSSYNSLIFGAFSRSENSTTLTYQLNTAMWNGVNILDTSLSYIYCR